MSSSSFCGINSIRLYCSCNFFSPTNGSNRSSSKTTMRLLANDRKFTCGTLTNVCGWTVSMRFFWMNSFSSGSGWLPKISPLRVCKEFELKSNRRIDKSWANVFGWILSKRLFANSNVSNFCNPTNDCSSRSVRKFSDMSKVVSNWRSLNAFGRTRSIWLRLRLSSRSCPSWKWFAEMRFWNKFNSLNWLNPLNAPSLIVVMSFWSNDSVVNALKCRKPLFGS